MILNFKIVYTNGTVSLRWNSLLNATYTIHKQVGLENDWTVLVEGLTDTKYSDTISDDGIYSYYVSVDGENQISKTQFICNHAQHVYADELKSVIRTALLTNEEVKNVVEDRIYYQSQPTDIVYPMIVFSLNEYSANSIQKRKDITIPVTVFSQDKIDYSKLRYHVMKALSNMSYAGRTVQLHQLQEIGCKGETLAEDKKTWQLEFTYKGKISIINL